MEDTPIRNELSEPGSARGESSPRNSPRINQNGIDHEPMSAMTMDDILSIGMANKLKEEGTRLFQRRDYEEAAVKFGKAIELLPKEHNDVAFLHCNIAACYMHMNPEDYQRAIEECDLALEASPKYTKALLKRARCYEALDKLDLACTDVQNVLSLEPNNVTALELADTIREEMEEKDVVLEEQVSSPDHKAVFPKEKITRKVSRKFRNSIVEEEVWEMIHDESLQENDEDGMEEKYNEDNHMENYVGVEQHDTEQMQVKRNGDNDERYTEDIRLKNEQYNLGASNVVKQLLDASMNMEGINLNKGKVISDHVPVEECKKFDQEKQQKHLKEINVNSQHKQESHTKQNIFSNVDKHKKHTDPVQFNSRREENNFLDRHIGRGEDKQGRRVPIRPVSYGREKNPKHIGESKKDIHKEAMRSVKFIFGDDIRIVVIPENVTLMQLMNIARYKYNPHLKSLLLKFMDREGDLVTITSSEELRWVEELDPQKPVRLYIKEVSPDREITRDLVMPSISFTELDRKQHTTSESGSARHDPENNSDADDWMVQFARLFKNHVGFDSDTYVDLRDLGMRLYYEAMEETITSEEAQEIFQAAEAKFQEMAALALFNWGNVHMSRARKRLFLSEDASEESILSQVKNAYEWACTEYVKAGKKFEEAVDVKPDFYEGLIALGQQQFEQAKLSWHYADACKVAMGTEVIELFNHAEDNMEKGMEMWEGIEYLRLKGLSKSKKDKLLLDKLGLNGHVKDVTTDEAFEQASNLRSQLNISWGTILYERSVVEFKLGLHWGDSLNVAIEKFRAGGASMADISVMLKNHCSNEKTQEGLSFKIDEIVQAWNEMYDAKKLKNGGSSFRLEPLFRRRPSKLHNILETYITHEATVSNREHGSSSTSHG